MEKQKPSMYEFFSGKAEAMKINYVTSDGKKFDNEVLANNHQDTLDRERYYNHLLSRRNWIQRLLNIKPSMKFYDEMAFKARFNK
jgi:hypothetical protein